MPIPGFEQPELIPVDETIRLRKYDGVHDFALEWYQDPDMIWMIDNDRSLYDAEKLSRMYRYLNQQGELYWIEALENGVFCPIGDVTFWQEDMPIVIGKPAWRGKGVGRKTVSALIQRGRELGYDKLYVDSIYHYNAASRKCFQATGFVPYQENEKGTSFVLDLKQV